MKPLTPELLLSTMDTGQTIGREDTQPLSDWAEGERVARELGERGIALGIGEIITTGTLTDAQPLGEPGRWRTQIDGIALPGLSLVTQWRG